MMMRRIEAEQSAGEVLDIELKHRLVYFGLIRRDFYVRHDIYTYIYISLCCFANKMKRQVINWQ